MKIEILKHPFDFKVFRHQLIFDQKKMSNDDAAVFGEKICAELRRIMGFGWHVSTCVGNKCTIKTKRIMKKEQRLKWKGKVVEVSDIPHFRG
jgi:hypothetical protein